MISVIDKLTSELAEVKAHKGKSIVLTITMKDKSRHDFQLGNGTWDVAPTELDGILTLRNNKEFADKTTSQTATELTTTYKFVRTDLDVAQIQSFAYDYERDVVQKIEPENVSE